MMSLQKQLDTCTKLIGMAEQEAHSAMVRGDMGLYIRMLSEAQSMKLQSMVLKDLIKGEK